MLGATPFDFMDFEHILGRYLTTVEARFVNLVYDPRGTVAGFSVAYPDYSDALRTVNARRNQHDDLQPRQADRVVLYMIGATPEEVERRHGMGSAIHYHTIQQILSVGYDTVLIAIIADDSGARGLLGSEMQSVQRTYALYELNR
jgi:hypothetical protein